MNKKSKNPFKRIKNSLIARIARIGNKLDRLKYDKLNSIFDKEFSFTEAVKFYKNRNDIYMYFHQYFQHNCQNQLNQNICS